MKDARYSHSATLLLNGEVLVAGGRGNVAYPGNLATAELFDSATGKWTVTGSMNQARRGHTATLLPDGRVLVAGGFTGANETTSSAELYDPQTGTWTPTAPMNTDRAIHWATAMLNGQVIVIGGYQYDQIGGNHLASTEIYDPQTERWQTSGSRDVYTVGSGFSLLPNGDVLATSGYGNNFGVNYPRNSEIYSCATGVWTNTGPCSNPRQDGTMTMLADGRVLFVGGRWGTDVLKSSEIFTSSAPVTPPAISIAATSTREIQVTFTNRPGALFQILCSSNPTKPIPEWWIQGGAIEVLPGEFQFIDPFPVDSLRFYRLVSLR